VNVGSLATQFLVAVVPITLGGVGWLIKNRRPRAVKAAADLKSAADARKTDAEAAAITAASDLAGVQYRQKQQGDLIADLYEQIRSTQIMARDAEGRARSAEQRADRAEQRADRAEQRIDVLERVLRASNIPVPATET